MAATRELRLLAGCTLLIGNISAFAGVLPEDRADVLYHSYDGGGIEIDGPSILVRKGNNKNFSVSANYYVDTITSASVDVVTQGSPYDEDRTQWTGTIDYLHADTTMSMSYTDSDEDDYKAKTASVSLTQSMFGDLTTVTLGYARGWDDVFRNRDPDFADNVDRQNYRLSLSQVLTKNMILSVNYEVITDEGFLNNPYRSVRYVDPTNPIGYSYQPEVYPNTRTSNAASANLLYYLPYRAALNTGYRYFTDDWDITAHTASVAYTHPLWDRWVLELNYRYYQQTNADFYSDLFPRENAQNFLARDKELSEFHDHTVGFGISYEFISKGWNFVDRAALSAKYNRIWFSYDNFRNLKAGGPVGKEPEYDFSANVLQLFVSVWY